MEPLSILLSSYLSASTSPEKLLLETESSVTEIASKIGYENPNLNSLLPSKKRMAALQRNSERVSVWIVKRVRMEWRRNLRYIRISFVR